MDRYYIAPTICQYNIGGARSSLPLVDNRSFEAKGVDTSLTLFFWTKYKLNLNKVKHVQEAISILGLR